MLKQMIPSWIFFGTYFTHIIPVLIVLLKIFPEMIQSIMRSKHSKLGEALCTDLTWVFFTWGALVFLWVKAGSFVGAFHVNLECFVSFEGLETGVTFVVIIFSIACVGFQMKNGWKH